jgi:hypothetical protein
MFRVPTHAIIDSHDSTLCIIQPATEISTLILTGNKTHRHQEQQLF